MLGEKLACDANGSSTYYRGGVMIYGSDDKLLYILTPEGTVARSEGSAGTSYTYNYFKKDHIGSTRAVLSAVDDTLQTVQSTDYYPFGLAFSTNNLNKNKYLFSGKELQDGNLGGSMLGLYDFGARHYDPFVARWLKQDRYAAKYASASPYSYCLNNPVGFSDPTGDTIKIEVNGSTVLWHNGNLFNSDGSNYHGAVSGDLGTIMDALNQLNSLESGNRFLSDLSNSDHTFMIGITNDVNEFKPFNNRNSYANTPEMQRVTGDFRGSNGSGGYISWNPNILTSGINIDGSITRPNYIGLGHELIGHGWLSDQGLLYPWNSYTNLTTGEIYNPYFQNVFKMEWQAVYLENQLRQDANVVLRQYYGYGYYDDGTREPIGASLLDADGQPKPYSPIPTK